MIKQIVSLLFLVVLCCCSQETKPPPPSGTPVNAMTIEAVAIPAPFEYVGVVQSSHLVEIRARVEGYLQEINYREGQLVHAGDILFKIDPRTFEAQLVQAKAQLEQQKAFLWEAQRTVARLEPLYEKKAASRRDLDSAIAEEQKAKAGVDSAQAAIIQAELNLSYTNIHSPVEGVTGESKFRVGSLVGRGENSLLTTVTSINPIWVNFSVSEGDILKYNAERKSGRLKYPKDMNFDVEVILSNGTTFPSVGKVDFADPTLQQSTGSMSVRAILPNSEDMLMPGQFVRARISGAVYPEAIAVPKRAVMQSKNGLFVYVVNKEDQAEIRSIEPGDWYEDYWIIKSGLNPGDTVIVDGTNKLMPGAKVIVQKVPMNIKKTATSP